METLYRARNWFASGPSILVLLALVIGTALHTTPTPKKTPEQPPMKISIAAPPEQAPPPPPMVQMEPLQEVTPELSLQPLPKLSQKATPKPAPSSTAAPTVAAQETPSAASSAPPVPTTSAPAQVPAARPTSAGADDAYAAQIKAYLNSIKHYPTSKEARLQRPHGVVNVWIVIDRAGSMKEAGVEDSSGSLILDGAALSTVRGASYPPIPADAFPGQATHRFTVQLNYQAA